MEEALRLNPKYTRARSLLAEIYLRKGEVEKGLKVCDESPSQDSYIKVVKAKLLSSAGRSVEAQRLLEEALRANNNLRKYGQ